MTFPLLTVLYIPFILPNVRELSVMFNIVDCMISGFLAYLFKLAILEARLLTPGCTRKFLHASS